MLKVAHANVIFSNFSAVCGGKIVKESGILSSPNYPDNYKAGKQCSWHIVVPEGYSVALKFHSFEVFLSNFNRE